MAGIGVDPYWELTFGREGHLDPGQRDRLLTGVAAAGVTDLLVFAHGWNSDHAAATRLHRRFFTPFPALLAGGGPTGHRVGYAGVVWPAPRFADEPVPDPRPIPLLEQTARLAARQGLDKVTLDGLLHLFPSAGDDLHCMAALLRERPESHERLAEFCDLARRLADGGDHAAAADTRTPRGVRPLFLEGEPQAVCAALAAAVESTGAETVPAPADEPDENETDTEDVKGNEEPAGAPPFVRLWSGARELLRQVVYHRTAGHARSLGESGLAPLLGELAEAAPGTRIHLVGHGYGARLVCFALASAAPGAGAAGSVTLLQGALRHSAFTGADGALRDLTRRIDGPLVVCHSAFDDALGVLYPLASRLPGDSEQPRAIGHDGLHGVPGGVRLTLADTAPRSGRPFPGAGRVSVDARAVVRRGHPPIGAHMDVCHAELARVVLRAARIGA